MDREALFRAHGRFGERLQGAYITAVDVGTGPGDMEIVRRETRHAAGIAGDPSLNTRLAREQDAPPPMAADRLAEQRLAALKNMRGRSR